MKVLKILVLAVFVLIILLVGTLGYFGFIPVLSSVFGSDKPRDLGVKYTEKQYLDYTEKAATQITTTNEAVSPENSLTYSGTKDLKQGFTQEEISARLNYSKWKYMPVKNVQIKIDQDGSVEFSGIVVYDRLGGFIEREGAGQYSKADIDKGLNYIKLIGRDFPVYAKFKASINNNQLTENIQTIEVGRFSIPLKTVNADSVVVSVSQSIMGKVPGFYAKSVSFENGKMNFEGNVPEKEIVESN
jgi:hypothetical protein